MLGLLQTEQLASEKRKFFILSVLNRFLSEIFLKFAKGLSLTIQSIISQLGYTWRANFLMLHLELCFS